MNMTGCSKDISTLHCRQDKLDVSVDQDLAEADMFVALFA
jgi:hypothetical protein